MAVDDRARPASTGSTGFVSIVGAGPGDPELLTYRAIQRLRAADLVLYDGLVPLSIVQLAASADHVSVSKRAGEKTVTQEEVIDRMLAGAGRGERVVRLKAGDPFVLGRGGEEMIALAEAGVPFEIVPGVTSATAAPAMAGIPVTHRGIASAVVVVSGHAWSAYAPLLTSIPSGAATIVVLMGLGQRARIAECLETAGWSAETPAALITSASQPDQRVWIGTLGGLQSAVEPDFGSDPGVIVIGDVVTLASVSSLVASLPLQEFTWQPTTIPQL